MLKPHQIKQALEFELIEIVRQLEIEIKNQRDTMNWSGDGNDREVWRFSNAGDIKQKLFNKINERLK